MTTYRTDNNWGVTIVREGHGEPNPGNCGLVDDELVAVVVNGDRELAEWICELLNAPTPDVPYTHGAAEALAEVRRRINRQYPGLKDITDRLLRDAAAELGVGRDRPDAHSGAETVPADSCTCAYRPNGGADPNCPVHHGRRARGPKPPPVGPGCICDGSGRTCPRHGAVI